MWQISKTAKEYIRNKRVYWIAVLSAVGAIGILANGSSEGSVTDTVSKSEVLESASGLSGLLLEDKVTDFYSDSKVTPVDVVKAYKKTEHVEAQVTWDKTLSFTNRKTANAMEVAEIGQGYKVVKVYQFGSGESAQVYKCFETQTASPHVGMEDEVSYNNYKLIHWYTLASDVDITNGFDSTLVQNMESVSRAGTEPGNIRLRDSEKTLVMLFEFQPIVEQLNVVKMVYQEDGLHIDTARIPFPVDNLLHLDTVMSNGEILGARGTGEDTFKLVSNWSDTNSFQNEVVKDNSIQLDLGINTLYLHILDKSLISEKGE